MELSIKKLLEIYHTLVFIYIYKSIIITTI